jgi:hypothetical protein
VERPAVERRRVGAFAAVSVVMLAASAILRVFAPSPFAPRIHVRWVDGVHDVDRQNLERRFTLAAGVQREGTTTWAYDLADPSPAIIQALIEHPAVKDTNDIDRVHRTVAPGATPGTTPLAHARAAHWIRSPLFDWFILLWVSGLVVSGTWLAGSGVPPAPAGAR